MERSSSRFGALGTALVCALALAGCTDESPESTVAQTDDGVGDLPAGAAPSATADDAVPGPHFELVVGESYRSDPAPHSFEVERLEAFFGAALEPLQELPGLLERPVSVVYERCGEANAFHDRATDTITLCHELSEYAADLFGPLVRPDSNDPETDATMLESHVLFAMGFVLYHEVAHALDFQRGLPIVGNFESAMDSIATVIAVETGRYLYALGGAALFGREPTSLAGQHGGGLDRLGDIDCWAIGGEASVQAQFVDPGIASTFDYEGAGRDCEAEYARLSDTVRAWLPELARLEVGEGEGAADAFGSSPLSLRLGDRWLAATGADPVARRRLERLFANAFAPVEGVVRELAGRLEVIYEDCGTPTSSLDAAARTVTLCEELVEQAYGYVLDRHRSSTGLEPTPVEQSFYLQLAYDFLGFALYHEIGHLAHALGRVPDDEPLEGAADTIAGVLLVESGRGSDAYYAASILFNWPADLPGFHGDRNDRASDLFCLALGGDAALRTDPSVPASLIEQFIGTEPSCVDVYAERRERVRAWLGAGAAYRAR